MGSFSTVKNVQYQFFLFNVVGPTDFDANKLCDMNALRFAIKRIVTSPVFIKVLTTHMFKEECC